jgi:hypothetical protein
MGHDRTGILAGQKRYKLRLMLAVTAVTALAIIPMGAANAQCIRQSLMNHDYCGAEAGKIKSYIPERPFGDFKGACAGHDACYQFGAESIVGMMEQRYRQTMLSATRAQKQEFRGEIDRIKSRCDRNFLSDMNRSCSRLASPVKDKCTQAASIYMIAVQSRLGKNAFLGAIDQAFTCRTR